MVHVFELVLSNPFLPNEVPQVDAIWVPQTRTTFLSCRILPMGLQSTYFVDLLRVHLHRDVTYINDIFLGLPRLRTKTILILNTAISFDIDQDFIFLFLSSVGHVDPQSDEGELHSFLDHTSRRFEKGCSFVKIPVAFRDIELDIAVDPVVSEIC